MHRIFLREVERLLVGLLERMDCLVRNDEIHPGGAPIWTAVDNPVLNCKKIREPEPPLRNRTVIPLSCNAATIGNCYTPYRGEYKEVISSRTGCAFASTKRSTKLGDTIECYITKRKWLDNKPCAHKVSEHCTDCEESCSCHIRPHVYEEDPYLLARFVDDTTYDFIKRTGTLP